MNPGCVCKCQPTRGSLCPFIAVFHERLGYLTLGPGKALMVPLYTLVKDVTPSYVNFLIKQC